MTDDAKPPDPITDETIDWLIAVVQAAEGLAEVLAPVLQMPHMKASQAIAIQFRTIQAIQRRALPAEQAALAQMANLSKLIQ